MRITTILFDVGGVLIAPLDHEAVATRREALAASLGFESAEAMWLHFYDSEAWTAAKTGQATHEEMWDELLRPHGYLSRSEQAHIVAELHDGEGVDPDMERLVAALHRDYRLAILSNWDDRLELLLDHFEISRYFDVILNSHRIGMAKPDEAAFRLTLEMLRVAPEELLFIDDRERNTRVAEQLGIASHVFHDLPALVGDLQEWGILDRSSMETNS
jgi:putative hydrolase of the HAD superfamily